MSAHTRRRLFLSPPDRHRPSAAASTTLNSQDGTTPRPVSSREWLGEVFAFIRVLPGKGRGKGLRGGKTYRAATSSQRDSKHQGAGGRRIFRLARGLKMSVEGSVYKTSWSWQEKFDKYKSTFIKLLPVCWRAVAVAAPAGGASGQRCHSDTI